MTEIRTLQPNDDDAYRALWLFGITEQPAYFRVAPSDESPHGIPTHFRPDSFTLGVFSGSDLVGVVSIERDTRAKLRHKALVFRMFIHPRAASQGIGRALLEHAIYLAQDLSGLKYLYLTVLASNTRAIHLYTALNFHEFAREHGGVLIGDQYIDELQMSYQLVGT